MRAWLLAVVFGVAGAGLGDFAAVSAGVNSQRPLWSFAGAAWCAILGAVLGGVRDILQAVSDSRRL